MSKAWAVHTRLEYLSRRVFISLSKLENRTPMQNNLSVSIPSSLTSENFQGKADFSTTQPSLKWRDLKTMVQISAVLEEISKLDYFRHRGRQLVGPCPIHGGENFAAFTVDIEKNLWYCFSRCGRGGTVIDLALALCNNSWPIALQFLNKIALRNDHHPTGHSRLVPIQQKPAGSEFKPFFRALSLDPTHPFLVRLGLRPDIIRFFEAGAWNGPGFLHRTIAVRLHDSVGKPLGYAGRRLDPQEIRQWGKWKWPRLFPKAQCLFNWHRVQDHLEKGLIIVEGAWSVMKLFQAGFPGVVALGGTGISSQQRLLLTRSRKIHLFLDGDTAGRAATKRLLDEKIHPNLSVINCNDGLDPADLSEEKLRELISQQFF